MRHFTREAVRLEAGEFVDQILDYLEAQAATEKTHIVEKNLFKMMLKMGLLFLAAYFKMRGNGDQGPAIIGTNGDRTPREREKTIDYYSLFGKLKISRLYYHAAGSPGVFPLDREANLPARSHSYALQELLAKLSVNGAFDEAVGFAKDFLGHQLSKRTAEEIVQEVSASYDTFYEQKEPATGESEGTLQVVSFDGKGVPMKKSELAESKPRQGKGEKRQTKREALVGVSYTVDPKERTAQEVVASLIDGKSPSSQEKPVPRAQNKRFIASLSKSKEEVMTEIQKDVERRETEQKRPLVCILDGARSLWKPANILFPQATFILDIIHVSEYLWEAAYVFHAEGSSEAREWVRERLFKLLRGKVGRVIQGLKISRSRLKLTKSKQQTLDKVIGYFERNRGAMRYDEYLAQGFPIGTGVVESACGHVVKARMEGSGMRWTEVGAEAMLRLRSVRASEDFAEYFEHHIESEGRRLHENLPWKAAA